MGFLSGLEKTAILNIFTAQSCARGQAVFVLETLYIFEPEISNKQVSKTCKTFTSSVSYNIVIRYTNGYYSCVPGTEPTRT
jgi:hypothetical protein